MLLSAKRTTGNNGTNDGGHGGNYRGGDSGGDDGSSKTGGNDRNFINNGGGDGTAVKVEQSKLAVAVVATTPDAKTLLPAPASDYKRMDYHHFP